MGFPLDESYVQRAERDLGATLPAAFRGAVMRDNGGAAVEWDRRGWLVFPIRDDSDTKRFKRTWDDIVVQTNKSRDVGTPSDYVVFAEADGDYLLFKIVEGRMSGDVYVWDHERGQVFATGESFEQLSSI